MSKTCHFFGQPCTIWLSVAHCWVLTVLLIVYISSFYRTYRIT